MGRRHLGRTAIGRWTTAAGVCLVATLGLGALTAPGAGAATPEFQVCAKAVPKKSGKYNNLTCSEAAFVPTGGQLYEREAFPWAHAKKLGFKDGGHGGTHWKVVNPLGSGGGPSDPGETVLEPKCKETRLGPAEGSKGEGEMTGPKTVTFRETYKECSVVKEAWKCKGNSNKKAYVVTEELEGTLVYLDAAHTRVGLRVKGLGPGGLVMKFDCPAANLTVKVYGEFLTELTGDINSASKAAIVTASLGSLELQSALYEEEAFSESQGKEVLEYDYALESCENGEAPYPAGTKSEAECLLLVGPAPSAAPPVTLLAEDSALSHKRLPMAQVSTTTHKGEDFLVETS